MTIVVTEKDVAFVAAREACVLTTYPDEHSPANGFGLNDPTLKPGDVITIEKACADLVGEMKENAAALDKIFAGVPLLPQHVGALLSLMWNIGAGALSRNVALIGNVIAFRVNKDQPSMALSRDLAAYQIVIANFDRSIGRPFNLSRRCREAVLFIEGDYGDLSTLELWPAGKSPRNTPPDPPQIVPMPTFLRIG